MAFYGSVLLAVLLIFSVIIAIAVAVFDVLARILTKTGAKLLLMTLTYLLVRAICEACVFAASSPVVKQLLLMQMNQSQSLNMQ